MKVIFTAAGSIGSRHIRNLSAICQEMNIPVEIDVIRMTDRVLPDDIKVLVKNDIRKEKDLKLKTGLDPLGKLVKDLAFTLEMYYRNGINYSNKTNGK